MGWTFPHRLLPSSALPGNAGLQIGGVALSALAAEHGTPVVVYDEEHLRQRCAEVMRAFPDGASYAGKAFLCRAMARLVHEDGLGIDVASSGELAIALAGGVPATALTLHGNNKSDAELGAAIAAGVGRIVIDSWDECDRVSALAGAHGSSCVVALRVNPGVITATHQSVMTGHSASKFGVAIAGGEAAALVARIQATEHLELTGIHVHAGSQIIDLEPLGQAIAASAAVARDCGAADLIVGGGIGVAYRVGQRSTDIADWGAVAHQAARASGFEGRILAEPGRTIAATAAATVYTIGTIKRLGERTILLAIDGGISDNPRPALYGSTYQPILVDHPSVAEPAVAGPYTVVGKNCESSDTFARDIALPAAPRLGDLLCLPVTGAYTYSMSSNYNGLCRPAVVMVSQGRSRVIVRRENIDDLLRSDVLDIKSQPGRHAPAS
jgi:diaminopimelate decarboxylase